MQNSHMLKSAWTPYAIAFDFDGTLVDSAPGILRGLSEALSSHHISPVLPLDRSIIGPPLRQTLAMVSGQNDPGLLDAISIDFIRFYDGGACLDTPAFPGIDTVLAGLRQRGHDLYLVTNKRGTPTRKILDHLGWNALFKAVYSLDEHADCRNKAQLLAKVIQAQALNAADTPYIGDTSGDTQAAGANAMPYVHVAWGYGGIPEPRPVRICAQPGELLRL